MKDLIDKIKELLESLVSPEPALIPIPVKKPQNNQ